MPNTELLRRTLNYIEAHFDEWDQSVWAMYGPCGSAYCFAGTTVMLSGGQPYFAEFFEGEENTSHYVLPGSIPDTGDSGSEPLSYSYVARNLLGLTERQAAQLFDPHNSLEDLRELVAEFTADEPALDTVAGV